MLKGQRVSQFAGFVAAGGIATVVNYAIFLGLMSQGVNYLVSSAIGYSSGIAVSYFLNQLLTFKGNAGGRHAWLRYLAAYSFALAGQITILFALVKAGISPEFGNAVAIVLVVIGNFFVVRHWVFPSPTRPKGLY